MLVHVNIITCVVSDKKIFTDASTHCPVGGQVTGAHSLEQYKIITSKHNYLEELRELGLTEEEIV